MKQVEIKVLVGHSGLHGSFVEGDKTLLNQDVAKRLEKVGYVEILKKNKQKQETATADQDKEVR
jgi:hypothetical protein